MIICFNPWLFQHQNIKKWENLSRKTIFSGILIKKNSWHPDSKLRRSRLSNLKTFSKLGTCRHVGAGAKNVSFEGLILTFSSLPKDYTPACQSTYNVFPYPHVSFHLQNFLTLSGPPQKKLAPTSRSTPMLHVGPFVCISMNLKPQGAPILKTFRRCMIWKHHWGASIPNLKMYEFKTSRCSNCETSRHMNSKPQCIRVTILEVYQIHSLKHKFKMP